MLETSTPLTLEQMRDWTAHVLAEFPSEACAYLVDDRIFPVANISEVPNTFKVNPIERMKAECIGKISGFLHSHPATPVEAANRQYPINWPTNADMVSWINDNTRWGISATDGEFVTEPIWMDENYTAPLEGRQFIHGIWDCYSAIRDWFKVNKGITLKNYPRQMDWWSHGKNLYTEQFADAGFVEVRSDEVQVGDCALMSIHSKGVICHAAVVNDDLNFYHHTYSRNGRTLSGLVNRGKWQAHVSLYIRYSADS